MDHSERYALLEQVFIATMLDELLPGILHNLANPLNGIMGRAKLMQRRLADFVRKLEVRYPGIETEMGPEYRKLVSDCDSINRESDRFYDLFNVLTGKMYAIQTRDEASLNLSRLVEAELAFADFYLDFKHHVRKEVNLDPDMPEVQGITAYWSLGLWLLIRQTMQSAAAGGQGSFQILTGHDARWVSIIMNHPGPAEVPGVDAPVYGGLPAVSPGMTEALGLLAMASPGVEWVHEEAPGTLTLRIPYRQETGRPG